MAQHMSTPITVREAIREAGSVTALSRRLECSRNAIYVWLRAGADLPELYRYRFLYAHKKAPKAGNGNQRGLRPAEAGLKRKPAGAKLIARDEECKPPGRVMDGPGV